MRIVDILIIRSERIIRRKVKLARMRPYNKKLTPETNPAKQIHPDPISPRGCCDAVPVRPLLSVVHFI